MARRPKLKGVKRNRGKHKKKKRKVVCGPVKPAMVVLRGKVHADGGTIPKVVVSKNRKMENFAYMPVEADTQG